ncbi:GPN-loop GTPase [Hyaloraphidium curvatum]|nr:GPN-loop GTPase [Hyaloraphidium curvatum]
MPFGQVIIGPPGSGKTTYCHGMSQFLQLTGRQVAIVNLDPANDNVPYTADVDVSELVTVEAVMEEFDLGPNGAMIYCMEYLEQNLDWLGEKLAPLQGSSRPAGALAIGLTSKRLPEKYLLFDCPGQVELYTHHNSLRTVIETLLKRDFRVRLVSFWDLPSALLTTTKLCAVSLVDAHHCTDPAKYISVLLLSLQSMIHLEMPHVNVLSKVDLMESYGKLAFNLEYYTEVQDLQHLLPLLNEASFTGRFHKLNEALVEMIESFNLVAFYTLQIEDRLSVLNLARAIDKANGYIFGGLDEANESIFATGIRPGALDDVSRVQDVYLSRQDDDDDAISTNGSDVVP